MKRETRRLWDGDVPNNSVSDDLSRTETLDDGDLFYRDVTIPDMTIISPDGHEVGGPLKPAILIFPGGGYTLLSYHKEGLHVAEFLARNGYIGVVVKYRIPNEQYQRDKTIAPLQDAQRAIQTLRERADEFGINREQVGVMGFSAGGHLASTVVHHWETPVIEVEEKMDLRPNFTILIYPVISFQDDHSHLGSRSALAGENVSSKNKTAFSAQNWVSEHTPPTFLVHSIDDDVVSVENSMHYLRTLRESNVPCEAHFYEKGGHGYGMLPGPAENWRNELLKWLNLRLKPNKGKHGM